MKKIILLLFLLVLSVSLLGCDGIQGAQAENDPTAEIPQQSDEEAITIVVEEFGSKLQTVSLLAPEDVVNKSMQENYGDLVSSSLLADWQNDPQNAPGRLTSSPWPDRIEIQSLEELTKDNYEVKGEIIEITAAGKEGNNIAAKRPITLAVEKSGHRWLITGVTLGAYEEKPTMYHNTQYGFSVSLPQSWQGYTVIDGNWEGFVAGGKQCIESGPLISLRHPQWTPEVQRQDIPIMVFTSAQWEELQQGEFLIGAGPVGPKELNRNSKYVFALPARYNYAFPPGFEEVESILENNPLQANEDYS